MEKYEYKIVNMSMSMVLGAKQLEKALAEMEEELNRLGQDGWELIQREAGLMYFKREI